MARMIWFNARRPTFSEGAKLAMVRELNRSLARRLRQIREELYGADGIPTLAEAIGIPEET